MKKTVTISILMTLTLTSIILWGFIVASDVSMQDLRRGLGIQDKVYQSKPYDIVTNIDIESSKTEYIRLNVVIETKNKKLSKTFDNYKAPISEILVNYINNQDRDKMLKDSNRVKVKEELIERIEKELNIEVSNIYFTNVVVGRD